MKIRVGSVVVGLTAVVFLLVFIGCSRQQETSDNELSGVDEEPNACTLSEWTEPLLDPAPVFYRSNGKPVTETVSFSVPMDGELCVVVTNGDDDPPHGHRISAAWISIDDELVIGPDPFDQNTAEIRAPRTVTAGDHELSVKLASKPGSFLTVQLILLARDEEPPVIAIEPAHGSQVGTDMPTISVSYSDAISGVNLNTLLVKLNGVDVTAMFSVMEDSASWALNIGSYLEEGDNTVEAWISDNRANEGCASTLFAVYTPTDILLDGLESDDPDYKKRSAYKLIFRPDEIGLDVLIRCLRQLNKTPEPKAAVRLAEILQNEDTKQQSRALSAAAIGEVFRIDRATANRADIIDVLGNTVMEDTSLLVKSVCARALGLSQSEYSLTHIDSFVEEGPRYPAYPDEEICDIAPQVCEEYIAYFIITGFQVAKSAIRIAGHDYVVGNPGDLLALRHKYLGALEDLIRDYKSNGGAP